ncbi:MAG: metallophosphoesterase family protein [Clostridiales bacterium]|nr:metallophosphoesterase family protein [Clostridiales bacterium]
MTHFPIKNGRFRICQLTDIHLEHDRLHEEGEMTYALIRNAVRDTSPDLVVITGDLAWGTNDDKEIDRLSEEFEKLGVIWAPVLGNHDGQDLDDHGDGGRRMFAGFLLNRPGGLFELGPDSVKGFGNYTVTVGGTPENPQWVLFMLDSHRGKFDISQLLWYRDTSEKFGAGHSELAFFHVPIPEFTEVWDYGDCKGFNQERVCATDMNDGLFSVMAKGGRMRGIFVGHDHINDYEGTLHGVRLCYGRGSGYQCYGLEGMEHGARIIDLFDGEKDFKTAIYLESGKVYEQTRIHSHKLNIKG